MAVNHRKDSIQLIRDTEGINNKDRVRILSPGSSPPEETTEVTEHALYMEPKNTPGDGEPYEYEFACCTGRRFIPQRAGDANKLEGKTSAEVKALFADGRAILAGSGTSVTLDAEGDRVHSITVNGYTKQEGTGDASPNNIRALTNGGLKLVAITFDGSSDENWLLDSGSGTAPDGSKRFYISGGLSIPSENNSNSTANGYYSGYLEPKTPSQTYGTDYPLSFSMNGASIHVRIAGISTLQALKAYLQANPLPVWYIPADESQADGIYIPIIGTGGEYSAKCVKINDKLCEGDKFISRTLSGCDRKLVLDGTFNWSVMAANSIKENSCAVYLNSGEMEKYGIPSKAFGYADYLPWSNAGYATDSPSVYAESVFAVRIAKTELEPYGYDGTVGTALSSCKAYLNENPLPVWYKSESYSPQNDKEVALETHVQGPRVLNGTDESWTKASDAGAYYSNFKGKPSGKIISEYLPYATATETKGGKTGIGIRGLGGIQLRLPNGENPAEYFPENPLLIVYELTSTIVYAHEPVDFEFSPGEDGVFTITGEADGTLDVYYKALQDGGDADKLGGKLPEYYAAAANALGQYTHTKSGTVHELTGTGDNIRFVATADFAAGDTVKVNGTTCTASTMSGDALWAGFFKSGAVVVCYRTGNALNFSGGGLAAAEAAKITPENLKTGVSVTVNGKTVAGTFTADGTAAAGDMLLGKTGYVKGQKVTGTIPSKAAASYKPGTSAQTIKAVQYLSGDQTIEGDAALIAANIKYGASIFDVDGSFTSDANAVAAEILTGKIGYVKGQKITGSMPNQGAMWEKLSINGTVTIPAGYHNGQGKVTQSIPTKGAASYKPGTSAQTILSGQYLTGNQTIQGDGNLVAGNIRSGVSIFGVAGSLKYQVSYPEVLAFNLDAPSPHPTPTRTTVNAPVSGNYRIQVRYNGHDSDNNGKFNVKIGVNGSWAVNESDDYDLNGTWTKDFYCNAGDQLMVEIGGYSPKASAYVIMYLNGQNAV